MLPRHRYGSSCAIAALLQIETEGVKAFVAGKQNSTEDEYPDPTRGSNSESPARRVLRLRADLWLTWVAIIILAAPVLFLKYLPTTDIPQHLAIASMLKHESEPDFGFDEYYETIDDRILLRVAHAIQYNVTLAVGSFTSLEFGIRFFIFLSLLAYPLGVLVALSALGKPPQFALLALPLVYNRAFFWGFASFNFSVGLALAACGILMRTRRTLGGDIALVLLSCMVVVAHIYGVAVLLGFVALRLLFGERVAFARRCLPVLPAALGFGLWAWIGIGVSGYGHYYSPPFLKRVFDFGNETLGGWQDGSDVVLLAGFGLFFLATTARGLPVSPGRWRALSTSERVLYLYTLLNFVLYFTLPMFTAAALFVHFRHAFLAVWFLPLLLPADTCERKARSMRALLAGFAVLAIAISWGHLVAFDRESRSFDRILEAMPRRPRMLSMITNMGDVSRTNPYLHYAAYIQAQRGGVIHETFPQMFWNLPFRLRDDAGLPRASGPRPWRVTAAEFDRFFDFYDYLLVRASAKQLTWLESNRAFSYQLLRDVGPWRLYHRTLP